MNLLTLTQQSRSMLLWLGTVNKSSRSLSLCSIFHGTSVLSSVLHGGLLIFFYDDCSPAPHIICSIQVVEEKFYFHMVFLAWTGLGFFLKKQPIVRRWFDWIKSARPISTALLLHCGESKLPFQGKSLSFDRRRRKSTLCILMFRGNH